MTIYASVLAVGLTMTSGVGASGGEASDPITTAPLTPLPPPAPAGASDQMWPVGAPADAPTIAPEHGLAPPHVNLEGTVGVGTPVGWLGIGASLQPTHRLALGVGAGLGTHGIQLASMLRVYPLDLSKRVRLGFGGGVSTGTFVASSLGDRSDSLHWDRYFQRAWFFNFQSSVLAWKPFGGGLEPFVGFGIVLNDRDGACAAWRSTCDRFDSVFFLGITLRYGVWL